MATAQNPYLAFCSMAITYKHLEAWLYVRVFLYCAVLCSYKADPLVLIRNGPEGVFREM